MIHILKIYTTNHSHYHQLVSLTKRNVREQVKQIWAAKGTRPPN